MNVFNTKETNYSFSILLWVIESSWENPRAQEVMSDDCIEHHCLWIYQYEHPLLMCKYQYMQLQG